MAFHQSYYSDCQESEYPDTSQEGMFIHLFLRISISILHILYPILRHLSNIRKCRCTMIYEIYNIFIHNYSNNLLASSSL